MCYQRVPHHDLLDFVDYRINEMNKVCGDAYKAHYECLDNRNQQYKDCRPAERGLNTCVLKKMVDTWLMWTDIDRD